MNLNDIDAKESLWSFKLIVYVTIPPSTLSSELEVHLFEPTKPLLGPGRLWPSSVIWEGVAGMSSPYTHSPSGNNQDSVSPNIAVTWAIIKQKNLIIRCRYLKGNITNLDRYDQRAVSILAMCPFLHHMYFTDWCRMMSVLQHHIP